MACDIGGFHQETEAVLLTRWYQLGVFLPIMRVHSTLESKPHWPFLWGEEAGNAMRNALVLRYRLIPYHYSLAHKMYKERQLWMRPLVIDFPSDERAAQMTSQWMDGDLLVAPVLRKEEQ